MAGFNKYVRILEQLAIYPLLVKKLQKKINIYFLTIETYKLGNVDSALHETYLEKRSNGKGFSKAKSHFNPE